MMYETQSAVFNGMRWHGTGEIVDEVSVHDWEEVVEAQDDYGYDWTASAIVSCGIIQEIINPEKVC